MQVSAVRSIKFRSQGEINYFELIIFLQQEIGNLGEETYWVVWEKYAFEYKYKSYM